MFSTISYNHLYYNKLTLKIHDMTDKNLLRVKYNLQYTNEVCHDISFDPEEGEKKKIFSNLDVSCANSVSETIF